MPRREAWQCRDCGAQFDRHFGKLCYAQETRADGLPALPELDIEQRPHGEVARRHRAHRRIARHVGVLGLADDTGELPRLLGRRQVLGRDGDHRLGMSVDCKAGVEPVRDSPLEAVAIDLLLLDQLPRRPVSGQVDNRRSRPGSYISGDPVGGCAHDGISHVEWPHVVRATAEDIEDARAAAEPLHQHCLWISGPYTSRPCLNAIGDTPCVADHVHYGEQWPAINRPLQMSIFSAISMASSTSMPR